MIGDARQHVGEPAARIELVSASRFIISEYMAAARSPPQSERANNHAFPPRASEQKNHARG